MDVNPQQVFHSQLNIHSVGFSKQNIKREEIFEESISPELLQQILWNVADLSNKTAHQVNRRWNHVTLETHRFKNRQEFQTFAKFLADHLEVSLYGSQIQALLSIHQDPTILAADPNFSPPSLIKLKRSLMEVKAKVIHLLKEVKGDDLKRLMQLAEQQSFSSVFVDMLQTAYVNHLNQRLENLQLRTTRMAKDRELQAIASSLIPFNINRAIETANQILDDTTKELVFTAIFHALSKTESFDKSAFEKLFVSVSTLSVPKARQEMFYYMLKNTVHKNALISDYSILKDFLSMIARIERLSVREESQALICQLLIESKDPSYLYQAFTIGNSIVNRALKKTICELICQRSISKERVDVKSLSLEQLQEKAKEIVQGLNPLK